MSRTLNFTLPAGHSGGKLTDFQYTRSINDLIGTWSAKAVGGSFAVNTVISIGDILTNGVITSVVRDSDGLLTISGYDAGVWLMCMTPNTNDLSEGNARDVIADLCDGCIPLVMSVDGLDGFGVRSVVSGSTRAEAILELALLSGCIAYINNAGQLVVAPSSGSIPENWAIIQDNGTELDTDGFANHVTTVVTRRKESPLDDPDRKWYSGSGTAPRYRGVWYGEDLGVIPELTRETTDNTFSFTDATGELVSVNYRVTMLVPINVMESSTLTLTRAGITTTTVENHDFRVEKKIAFKNNQQTAEYAWCEQGHTITTTKTNASYSINDSTTETMTRTFGDWQNKDWTSEVWKNTIAVAELQCETIVKQSTRAGQTPDENMPDYAPPFDAKITREYKRLDFGKSAICVETIVSNEARQVGKIDTVKVNNVFVTTADNSILAIPTHSTPKWVEVVKQRVHYEKYDGDGNCLISSETETTDDGAAWLLRNLNVLDDAQLQQWQTDYAKNSQIVPEVKVQLGGGSNM